MKKIFKLTAVLLSVLMLIGLMPFSVFAYGEEDGKLSITHFNTFTPEGAGAILTPAAGDTVPSSYAWWVLVTFDWDETDYCYKVTRVQNAGGVDKSTTEIPEKGFVYAVNIGNNYPKLYKDTGNEIYKDKPNYINEPTLTSYNYALTLEVGAKAYVYNTDLLNCTLDTNGKDWYMPEFESNSYIKIGTPDSESNLYDPNNEMLLQHTLDITHINAAGSTEGMSIIYTRDYGTDIFGSQKEQKYNWWKVAVFEWDDSENCYVLSSLNTVLDNNSAKQAVIPENGFVLGVCTSISDANDATKKTSENMNKLKIGSKAYLYGADLEAGTIDSAKICVNLPDDSLTAYTPDLSGDRIAAPVITNMTEKRTVVTDAGFEIKWDAVEGADGYVVYVNNATYVTDGLLAVKNTAVTETSYKIESGVLKVGNNYTVSVYATADGKVSSRLARAKLAVISQDAFESNLRDKTIIAFGDSLTARAGWVSLLGGRVGAEVINSGVGGDTTKLGRNRFAAQVTELNPDIVIINFGMNDQAQVISQNNPLYSLDKYTENLDYFAKTLTEAGIDVVFVTPNKVCAETGYYKPGLYDLDYSTDNMLAYCDAMRNIAIKYGCDIVDINRECEDEDLTKFCNKGDGIHQSKYGHQRYTDLIGDYLAAVYDNKNLSSVEVKYVDGDGKEIADSVTLNAAKDADIFIPAKDIEGYIANKDEQSYTFKETAGTVEFTYTESDGIIELKEDSGFVIEGNQIYLNEEELIAENVLDNIKTPGVECILNSDNSDYVGTGSKLQLKSGSEVILELTVVLGGDTSGDGKVNAKDYLMVKRHFLKTYTLADEFFEAGDINDDNDINSKDYLKIKRHFLGTYDIYKK